MVYSKLSHIHAASLIPGSQEAAKKLQQELSYRKQIARKLRTQYVEAIYRPKYYTMTLKSRLRVTQGYWKKMEPLDRSYTTYY